MGGGGYRMIGRETMWVDDKITMEFLNGDLTAQAYRKYLLSLMERTPSDTNPTEHSSDHSSELSFRRKAEILLKYIRAGKMYADNWEKRFVQDNTDNEFPSEAQVARMDKLWRNIQYSAPVGSGQTIDDALTPNKKDLFRNDK
jgi:hypothetical protein